MTLQCARKKRTTKYSFAVYQKKAHDNFILYREPKHTAKRFFTVCYIFTVCAHGKEVFCRVPDRKHTTTWHTARARFG